MSQKRREYEMIVECPKCKKKYRVDKTSIPPGGASVKCPDCSNLFTIFTEPVNIKLEPVIEETGSLPDSDIVSQPETFAPQMKDSEPVETYTAVQAETPEESKETEVPPTGERTKLWEKLQQTYISEKEEKPEPIKTATAQPTAVEEEIAKETEIAAEEAPTAETITEEPETEEQKTEKEAKRLSRSLVKDILLYHGDKVEIGLKQGNLAHLIGDEIRKSWKYYKDTFPLEKTGGVNFFKNALNEIIGKGKPIFK